MKYENKRKNRKAAALIIMAGLVLMALSACGGRQEAEPVNEMTFSLDKVKELTISYDEEDIRFLKSGSGELIIKEYMSKDKKKYYARVSQNEESVSVSEGGKPLFGGDFQRRIEVYLPDDYSESLKVTSTDGNIDMSEMDVNLASLRVDCSSGTFKLKAARAKSIHLSSTSGTLELGDLAAKKIRVETTEGEVRCARAEGYVAYTSTSGNGEFQSVTGSGTYKAENSGKLSVAYEEVTGDLSLYNKNDSVKLWLPEQLSFAFKAATKNGSVSTNFQEAVSVKGDSIEGTVGNDPTVTVKVETKNGNIEVRR